MKYHIFSLIGFFLFSNTIFAQQNHELDENFSNEIFKPSVVSTHPFGIFLSRWQGNFQFKPSEETTIDVNLESGNVWSPPVTAYIPNEQIVRDFVSQFEWHEREFKVDVDTLDAKTIMAENDGVIKGFRANIRFKLNANSELKVGVRTFLLTKGKFPFSIITSDETIESFHDNIAGGEDPFDRKLYPFNEAKIRFKDRNDNTLTFDNSDFVLGGIEANYFLYPEPLRNEEKRFSVNFGAHLGLNISSFNSSVDLGLSANTMKQFILKNNAVIAIGASLGANRLDAINFDNSTIELNTNDYLGHLEGIFEYSFVSAKKMRHAFGADFYVQSSLYKKSEFDYLIPTKNGTSTKSWNSGTANLYRNTNYWTLMYTFQRKTTTTLYIQQDLTVNNNPDIQAGIRFAFTL